MLEGDMAVLVELVIGMMELEVVEMEEVAGEQRSVLLWFLTLLALFQLVEVEPHF